MWIEIKNEIFEPENIEKINFLLKIIFERPRGSSNTKANLYVDIREVIESQLFNSLSSTDQGLIEDSIKLFSYEENPQINYTISNDQSNFNLDESLVFFREPLWIVLENSMNDSNFIKSIIYNLDDEKNYLRDCLNNRWIDFANAGGSGAKNQIKGKLASFDNLSAIHGTNSNKYYRGFVLLDSDSDFLGQGVKEGYNTLISFLNEKEILWHILEKRAMENYMPDEVIFDIRNKKSNSRKPEDKDCIDWINVYQYLDDIQKNYLKYSGQKTFNDLAPEAQTLYLNQSTTNYLALNKGICYRDNETLNIEEDERRYKNSFPKFYVNSPLLNKVSLEKRCGNDELQIILTKIKSML